MQPVSFSAQTHLYVANEGKLVAICPESDAAGTVMRAHPWEGCRHRRFMKTRIILYK